MKLKMIGAMAVAMLLPLGAQAQEVEIIEEMVETAPAGQSWTIASEGKSNWWVAAGTGPQIFIGDHDRQRKLGQRISPNLDISVGKWITPVVGMRLMYTGLYAKGATQNGIYSTGKRIDGKPWEGYWLEDSKFSFMNLHVDVLFDLCNMIKGYDAHRPYSIAFYAGGGYGRVLSSPHQNGISGDAGFFNMWHVSKALDVNLDLRLTAFPDGFDGAEGNRPFDGLVTVSAGVSYRFAPRGWKSRKEVVKVYEYDNTRINELREQVNALIAENERIERESKKNRTPSVAHNTVEYIGGAYLIYFPINQSELSLADRAQLEQCAEYIKKAPEGAKFYVIGYADKSTGTARINEILSRARAESVSKCLVDEFGVGADRLDLEWKGGVDNMYFDDPALSRMVIIKPAE